MTRAQWYAQHRDERLLRKEEFRLSCTSSYRLTSRSLVRALKSIYTYEYLPYQDVLIRLLARYQTKLPRSSQFRMKKLIHSWTPEARRRGKERLKSLVYKDNPFLALIPKGESSFAGKYIPVPIEYGENK